MMSELAEEQLLRIRRLTQEGAFATEEEALDEALDLLEHAVEIMQVRARIKRGNEEFAQGGGAEVTPEWLADRAAAALERYRGRRSGIDAV